MPPPGCRPHRIGKSLVQSACNAWRSSAGSKESNCRQKPQTQQGARPMRSGETAESHPCIHVKPRRLRPQPRETRSLRRSYTKQRDQHRFFRPKLCPRRQNAIYAGLRSAKSLRQFRAWICGAGGSRAAWRGMPLPRRGQDRVAARLWRAR